MDKMKSTETEIELHINKELNKFNVTNAGISELREKYLPLKINGQEDNQGYLFVRAARMDIKAKRIEVDKMRKELTEDALKVQRAINGEAKRIIDELKVIEDYLSKQEDEFEAEKERIKQEKVLKENEARKAEDDRLKAEAQRLQAEREALAKERAEIEAEKARLLMLSLKTEEAESILSNDFVNNVNGMLEKATIINVENNARTLEIEDGCIRNVTVNGGSPGTPPELLISIGFDQFDQLIRGNKVTFEQFSSSEKFFSRINLELHETLSYDDIQTLLDAAQGMINEEEA